MCIHLVDTFLYASIKNYISKELQYLKDILFQTVCEREQSINL